MKRRKLGIILGAEGAACGLLALLLPAGTGIIGFLAAFPFAQIGLGLRALSLSGPAGNGAAVALYVLLSLLPLGWLGLRAARKRPLYWEDSLAALLTPLLFWVLYRMVNPGSLGALFGGAELVDMGRMILGASVWSVAVAYAILRLLRAFGRGGQGRLLRWLDRLLAAACALLTAALAWGLVRGGMDNVAALAAANTTVPTLGVCFAVLRAAVDVLPYGLELWVIFAVFPLTAALADDPYGAAVVPAAERLARRCRTSVAALVLAQAGFNLLQLPLAGAIRTSSFWIQLPLFDLGVVLAVMLAADVLAGSRRLKEENDSFV